MSSRAMQDGARSTFPDDNGIFPSAQDNFIPVSESLPDQISSGMLIPRDMPKPISRDMPWHPLNIAARIDLQAALMGMSRTALLKAAGVHEKAIRDLEVGHWPNLRKLVQLAEAFKFRGGVAALLGVTEAPDNRCDPRILHVALELVAAAMDMHNHDNPLITKPHIVAGLAAMAHQQLVELRRIDSNALDNTAALHMISVMLRSELANFDREKS